MTENQLDCMGWYSYPWHKTKGFSVILAGLEIARNIPLCFRSMKRSNTYGETTQ